ncbi:MAG: hypothetical protein KDA25_03570 [Phycisphaerales bacterium]|nr:hypothetical protein [Phycisphaerales bacterium]
MPAIAMTIGLLLTLLGVGTYLAAGRTSATALIPAGFGIVLLVLGLVARAPGARKHAMHVALLVALLGAVGAGMRVVPAVARGEWSTSTAFLAQVAMIVLCVVFLALGVRSFISARRTS